MFGDWEVISKGKKIEKFTSKKALKILFYVLLKDTSRVSIKELAEIFWEYLDYNYVRKNLNAQLYYIRKDLGVSEKHFGSERDYVYIDKNVFESDYKQFMRCSEKIYEKASIEKIKSLYKGELLSGLKEPWIEKYRTITRKLYENAISNKETKKVIETQKIELTGFVKDSPLINKNLEVILKAKVILEQQTLTREKYFVPLLINGVKGSNGVDGINVKENKNNSNENNKKKESKDNELTIKREMLRKGDILIELGDKKIILLERGRKEIKEVVNGFLKRMELSEKLAIVPEETEILNILNTFLENS